MSPKAAYAFQDHEDKVDELKAYLRWSKRIFAFLIATAIVNIILTYGLIFHPSKPSVTTCAQFCSSIETRHASDIPQLGGTEFHAPAESSIAVRSTETPKDLVLRSASSDSSGLAERAEISDLAANVKLAMAGVWVTSQAMAWWNMVGACEDFSNNPNSVNCVWGAISTVITAAVSGVGIYKGIGRVQTWMNNNGITIGGFKRDVIDQDLLDGLSSWFGSEVTHLGVWDYSSLQLSGTLSARDNTAPLDVFGMKSHSGHDLHFSYLGNSTGKATFKFGLGSGTSNTTVRGRGEVFDQQYFTSGGIDFILDPNPEDGGTLDSYSDYWYVYDQVSCIMNIGDAMTAAGHYFQMYDNLHQGTMAGGAIAPFRGSDHWSAITTMYNEPTPLLETTQCGGSNKRAVGFEA